MEVLSKLVEESILKLYVAFPLLAFLVFRLFEFFISANLQIFNIIKSINSAWLFLLYIILSYLLGSWINSFSMLIIKELTKCSFFKNFFFQNQIDKGERFRLYSFKLGIAISFFLCLTFNLFIFQRCLFAIEINIISGVLFLICLLSLVITAYTIKED